MTAPLSFAGVHKSFGPKTVLRGIDGEVQPGEILGIVGPSGSGKTTALRLLDLLDAPDRGQILYRGERFSVGTPEALAQRRRMALVMQNPACFRASVMENVSFGLWLRGRPPEEIRGRVFAALESVGLLEAAHQRADLLSGGEQQRVAFARAAILNPEVLLLDEFTANLDPANVRLLEDAILRYRRESGCAVVAVTHNLFQAKRIADRVALLLDGRFVEVSRNPDFFENPRTPEARAFLSGEMPY